MPQQLRSQGDEKLRPMLVKIKPRFSVIFLFFFCVHLSCSTHSTNSIASGGGDGSFEVEVEPEPPKDDCTESEAEVGPDYHDIQPPNVEDGGSKPNISLDFGTDYDMQPRRRRKCKKTAKSKCNKLKRKNIGRIKKGKKKGGAAQKKERSIRRLERKRKRRRPGRTDQRFGNRNGRGNDKQPKKKLLVGRWMLDVKQRLKYEQIIIF